VVRGTLIASSTADGRQWEKPYIGERNPFFFVPEADDHEALARIFVPRLREGEPFRVRLDLIDASGALARAETKPFE
jgi:hypothetical protein